MMKVLILTTSMILLISCMSLIDAKKSKDSNSTTIDPVKVANLTSEELRYLDLLENVRLDDGSFYSICMAMKIKVGKSKSEDVKVLR